MASPHALVLPYPAQGHVIPLMELSHRLIECGFKITFVNTDFNHDRVITASSQKLGTRNRINLTSIPDGLAPGDDRNDLGKLTEAIKRVMPGFLEELMQKQNESGDDKITCLISDQSMAWALIIAKKFGLRTALFAPTSAAVLLMLLSTPKLVEDGIVDNNGSPTKQQLFQLVPGMPLISTSHLTWCNLGSTETQPVVFKFLITNAGATKLADFLLCNTFNEIEPQAISYMPKISPIGPLLACQEIDKPTGNFWTEDSTCTDWLDRHPANSVIYVAFGSFTIFDQHQFQELAHGLELSGRPFLWVVRADLTQGLSPAYPPGFHNRVSSRGKIVGWAPQQRVLSHPSVACFLSHCGWNSTMEGVRNGIPFLCLPYFVDQFINQNYLCDYWKIGLKLKPDEKGLISKDEIKVKLQGLVEDKEIRERSQVLKEITKRNGKKGGASFENFKRFVDAMKE